MAVSQSLPLSAAQRTELQAYLRKQNLPASVAQRMGIILALADGLSYHEIMDNLSTTRADNQFVEEAVRRGRRDRTRNGSPWTASEAVDAGAAGQDLSEDL